MVPAGIISVFLVLPYVDDAIAVLTPASEVQVHVYAQAADVRVAQSPICMEPSSRVLVALYRDCVAEFPVMKTRGRGSEDRAILISLTNVCWR